MGDLYLPDIDAFKSGAPKFFELYVGLTVNTMEVEATRLPEVFLTDWANLSVRATKVLAEVECHSAVCKDPFPLRAVVWRLRKCIMEALKSGYQPDIIQSFRVYAPSLRATLTLRKALIGQYRELIHAPGAPKELVCELADDKALGEERQELGSYLGLFEGYCTKLGCGKGCKVLRSGSLASVPDTSSP